MKTLVAVLLAIAVAGVAACSSNDATPSPATGTNNTPRPAQTVDARVSSDADYSSAMGAILAPVLAESDNWTTVADRQAKVDASTLSVDDAIAAAREALAAATKLHSVTADATTAIRNVIPPADCEGTHLKLLEALQLIERGSLDAKTYYEIALRPSKPDQSRIQSANDLFARADQAKVEAELAARREGCALIPQ